MFGPSIVKTKQPDVFYVMYMMTLLATVLPADIITRQSQGKQTKTSVFKTFVGCKQLEGLHERARLTNQNLLVTAVLSDVFYN